MNYLTTRGVNTLRTKIVDTEDGIQIKFKQTKGYYSDGISKQKLTYLLIERTDSGNDSDENSMGTIDTDESTPTYEITRHSIFLNDSTEAQYVNHRGYKAGSTFVIANSDDEAYIQYTLSLATIDAFSEGLLAKIPDSISRCIVWRSIISMASKLMIKSTTFFKIVIENIGEEDDIVLLDTLLPTFAACAS